MKRNVIRAAFAALRGFWIVARLAQTYPSKPIRLLNPLGTGGLIC